MSSGLAEPRLSIDFFFNLRIPSIQRSKSATFLLKYF